MRNKAARGEALAFLQRAFSEETDDCIIWPFARMGPNGISGAIKYRGKKIGVHRIVCLVVHGDPPTELHEAAHTCPHTLCINPAHVVWRLPKEITELQRQRGTMPIGEKHVLAKLSEVDVREIRALKGTVIEREVAEAYGICRAHVGRVLKREVWRHLA